MKNVPDTSMAAFADTESRRETHMRAVLDAMRSMGRADASDVQAWLIVDGRPMNIYEVRRRLSDLANQRLIVDSGERSRSGENGRPTIVWRVNLDKQRLLF